MDNITSIFTEGVRQIALEREEQLYVHKITTEHDDQYISGELVAAAIYALTAISNFAQPGWEKFNEKMAEEKDIIKRLRIAGALIAAEIERIIRVVDEAERIERASKENQIILETNRKILI